MFLFDKKYINLIFIELFSYLGGHGECDQERINLPTLRSVTRF